LEWIKKLSETEARTILALIFFLGFCVLLGFDKITSDQFLTLMAVDGLLWKLLEKPSSEE